MYGGYEDLEQVLNLRMPQNPNRGFSEMYRCAPVAMMPGNERQSANYGGKIFLPMSALEKLASLNIEYPMLFELKNKETERHSHAGVLEFIAEEGRVFLPYWMMQTLLLEPGDLLEVKNITLPLGSFVKIQPQSVDFLDISDPKAVLENALRNFSTLTQGDIIQILYNNKTYEIMVLEVSPRNNGISIVETDLEVDFAPPVGYVEPTPKESENKMQIDEQVSAPESWSAFQGSGQRLNGKTVKPSSSVSTSTSKGSFMIKDDQRSAENVPAPLNLPFGKLFFGYKVVPLGEKKLKETQNEMNKPAFEGEGQLLRPKKVSSGRSATSSPTPSSSSAAGTSSSAGAASSSSVTDPSSGSHGRTPFGGAGHTLK